MRANSTSSPPSRKRPISRFKFGMTIAFMRRWNGVQE